MCAVSVVYNTLPSNVVSVSTAPLIGTHSYEQLWNSASSSMHTALHNAALLHILK